MGGLLQKSITIEDFSVEKSRKACLMLWYVDDERKLKYISSRLKFFINIVSATGADANGLADSDDPGKNYEMGLIATFAGANKSSKQKTMMVNDST